MSIGLFALLLIGIAIVPKFKGKEYFLIVSFGLVFSVLLWPYSIYLEYSEITVHYFKFINLGLYNWNIDYYAGMPLFYNLAIFSQKLFGLDNGNTISLLRFAIFILNLFAIKYAIKKESNINPIYIVYLSIILLSTDFASTYQSFGDQFKNVLGMPFWIASVIFFKNKRKLLFIASSFVAILSHHIFIPMIFISIIFLIYSKKIKNITFTHVFILSLFIIFGIIILKYLIEYFSIGFWGDKLSANTVIGIIDALMTKPGNILAISFYLLIITLLIKDKFLLNNSHLYRFSVLMIISLFVVSKINLINIEFVGATRLYLMMSPWIAISLAYTLHSRWRNYRYIILSVYFLYNLLLVEFSSGSISPIKLMFHSSLFDIFTLNFNSSISIIFSLLSIIFLVFFVGLLKYK
jgi:hypothetical protein